MHTRAATWHLRGKCAMCWLERDNLVACPDPEERLVMRIERTRTVRLDPDELT